MLLKVKGKYVQIPTFMDSRKIPPLIHKRDHWVESRLKQVDASLQLFYHDKYNKWLLYRLVNRIDWRFREYLGQLVLCKIVPDEPSDKLYFEVVRDKLKTKADELDAKRTLLDPSEMEKAAVKKRAELQDAMDKDMDWLLNGRVSSTSINDARRHRKFKGKKVIFVGNRTGKVLGKLEGNKLTTYDANRDARPPSG